MIVGIGIDIVEINRLAHSVEKQPRFPERILHAEELQLYTQLTGKRQIEYLAGRFAAKEAFSKALGTGIGEAVTWHDLVIHQQNNGSPQLIWHKNNKGYRVHLSISHSAEYAVAHVVLEENF